MKLTREVKTGLLVLTGIALLIFGYSFLKNTGLFDSSRMFYVEYENVAGLAPSAPVTINGLNVGKVNRIDFSDNQGKLIVEFIVDKEFDFAKNSIVQIYSSGLIGGNNLGIIPGNDRSVLAQDRDTLTGTVQAGMIDGIMSKLGPLEKSLVSTLGRLDSVLVGVGEVLDDKTKQNLRSGIANLNQTMASFKGVSQKANALLADNQEKLNSTFENLDNTSKNFSKLSDSLAQINMGEMVKSMEATISKLNAIATDIDQGEGSVGKLLKDEELYDNLSGASLQLEQLLEDMKLNPKRYVHFSLFGKRPKQYNSPKDTIK